MLYKNNGELRSVSDDLICLIEADLKNARLYMRDGSVIETSSSYDILKQQADMNTDRMFFECGRGHTVSLDTVTGTSLVNKDTGYHAICGNLVVPISRRRVGEFGAALLDRLLRNGCDMERVLLNSGMIRRSGRTIRYGDKVYAPCEAYWFDKRVLELYADLDNISYYQECDEVGHMIDGEILEYHGSITGDPDAIYSDSDAFEKDMIDVWYAWNRMNGEPEL